MKKIKNNLSLLLATALTLTQLLSTPLAQAEAVKYPKLTCDLLKKMALEEKVENSESISLINLFKPTQNITITPNLKALSFAVRESAKKSCSFWAGPHECYRPDMTIEEVNELGEGIFFRYVDFTLNSKVYTYLGINFGTGGGNAYDFYFELEGNSVKEMTTFYFFDGDCSNNN